jgi:dCTP deaminase
MLLSRRDIIRRVNKGDIVFTPAVSAIDQVSVDLRIGRLFTKFVNPAHAAAIRFSKELFLDPELWTTEEKDSYFLKPNEFILAKTHEFVQLPYDLTGLINGRSSWARIGLGVHLTAPKIDPGFKGRKNSVQLRSGRRPLLFRRRRPAPPVWSFTRGSGRRPCRPSESKTAHCRELRPFG